MEFIKLPREENILTKPLYEEVFSEDKGAFSDYYYDHAAVKSDIYVARDENGIHSMVHLNPYLLNWNGDLIEIPYIVAVATSEKQRHRGLMRGLLEQIFRDLEKRHVPFAFLMPVNEAIYTPFGFERTWSWQWEEDVMGVRGADPEQHSEGNRLPGGGMAVCGETLTGAEECSDKLLADLSDHVNTELSGKFELFTHRSAEYYRKLAFEQKASGGQLLICMKNGIPQAAIQTARENYPPMMCRIMDREAYERRLKREGDRPFEKAYVCEVV